MTDDEVAAQLAAEAGHLLMSLRESRSLEGAAMGLAGDRVANAYLMTALAALRPQDAVLCEECTDDPERLGLERLWIVDPLDGTREYVDRRGDWAVHVALSVGGVPVCGAVAVPARDLLFATGEVRAPSPREGTPVMVVSRTRRPPEAEALAAHLGAEIREMGSAGAKAMAVVSGEADIYFHSGGQSEWDNCAPAAVALAAGLHATRADGSPLLYNRADVNVPDLVIATPEFGARAVAFLRSYSAER